MLSCVNRKRKGHLMGVPKTNVKFTVRDNCGYYKWNKGKNGNYYRTFYDQKGQQISQSAFLKSNNAVIDSGNAMRKKEHVKQKSDNQPNSVFNNPVGKNKADILGAEAVGDIKKW